MFSVKVIRHDNSEYVIPDVTLVETYASDNVSISDSKMPGAVHYFFYEGKEHHFRIIDSGHVYVMNEQGKTVADYHMYPKPAGEVSSGN